MKDDPFALARFIDAQEGVYAQALAELRRGRKESHWMWFIFPQAAGLGTSPLGQRYAIKSRAEAVAYLAHPVLGTRLEECVRALLALPPQPIGMILPSPDDLKLKSSLTLFAAISEAPVFNPDCPLERARIPQPSASEFGSARGAHNRVYGRGARARRRRAQAGRRGVGRFDTLS